MADVNINIFTNKVYKQGASTVVPGFIEGEEPTPINPSGSGGASEFVPYVGATENFDLGEFGLSAGFLKLDTTPTNTPTDQGTMYWDEDDNTVDIILNGYIMKVGEDLFYPVKNQTGSSIAKGTNVGFAGTLGMSGRLLITPYLANGANPTSRYMGVTAETIADGEDGKVLWFGRVRGINTNAFNEGDILYASTSSAGAFQTTLPVAPNNIVEVAAVITKSVNNGVIFVRPQFLSSASIGGSGTTNYVPRFTGATTIGNSQIIDNGTNVLINKTSDSGEKLQVNGSAIFNGAITSFANNPLFIMRDTDGDVNALYLGADFAFSGGTISYGAFAINRNPANGVFFNTGRAASQINLESSNAKATIAFYTHTINNVTPLLRFFIADNGNIGIGQIFDSSPPTAKLQIRGISNGTDSTLLLEDSSGNDLFAFLDNGNISIPSTNGAKIGTATTQKIGFWNATPIVQPTTGIAESAFVENSGGVNVNDDSTFDGYTLRQVVKALRDAGLLA